MRTRNGHRMLLLRTWQGAVPLGISIRNFVGALSGHKECSKAFAQYQAIDDDMKKELIDLLAFIYESIEGQAKR